MIKPTNVEVGNIENGLGDISFQDFFNVDSAVTALLDKKYIEDVGKFMRESILNDACMYSPSGGNTGTLDLRVSLGDYDVYVDFDIKDVLHEIIVRNGWLTVAEAKKILRDVIESIGDEE